MGEQGEAEHLVSTWGSVSVLSTAPSIDTPAAVSTATSVLYAAFEHLDGERRLVLYTDESRTETEITAIQPRSLSLARLPAGRILATWLDRSASGISTLYATQVDREGASLFGALAVSNSAVTRYDLINLREGGAWAVWSATVSGEPTLVASRLDDAGRPRLPQLLRLDADFPALAVLNSGEVLLFWLQGESKDLFSARLNDTGLTDIQRLAASPWAGARGDLLSDLVVGVDQTHGYAVFQTVTSVGFPRAVVASGPLDQANWGSVRPIGYDASDDPLQTGFNHGTAFAAAWSPNNSEAAWIAPARGQYDLLAAAAVVEGDLRVLYFAAGELVGAQDIAALPNGLIAAPSLVLDDERDLSLAWWQPGPSTAVLYAVSSR